jgi:hypothetical protein
MRARHPAAGALLVLACGGETEFDAAGPPGAAANDGNCSVAIERATPCPTGSFAVMTEITPVALRTDGTSAVYATASLQDEQGARLEAVPLSGGAPRTLYTYEIGANQSAWTLHGGSIYLNDGAGHILRVPVDGRAALTLHTQPPRLAASHFVADDRWLYFGERDNEAGTEKVYRLALSGGAPEQLSEVAFSWEYTIDYTPNQDVEVAVDGCSLYWLHQRTIPRNGGSNDDGTVYRIPKNGGAKEVVISGLTAPVGLNLTNDAVWVMDRGDDPFDHGRDRFVGADKNGDAREPVVFAELSPATFVVDFGRAPDAIHYVLYGPPSDLNAQTGFWTQSLTSPGPPTLIADASVSEGFFTAAIDRGCGHLYSALQNSIVRQTLP